MAISMCKGCGTMKAYMDGVCKGCHSLRDSNLFKEDEGVKKAESSSSETGSETTSEHGEQEVRMSLQQLHSVCEAATKLKGHVKKETLVPAWVQSLLTVAHENLEHIEGYFEGKHMKKGGDFVMPTSESHKPRMPIPTRGMKKPPAPSKGMNAGHNIALSETAQETDVEKANVRPRMAAKRCDQCGGPTTQPGGLRYGYSSEEGRHVVGGTPTTCGKCASAYQKRPQSAEYKEAMKPRNKLEALKEKFGKAEAESEGVSKSLVPTFPRVTGDSRVLLHHITPNQQVVQQITGRDTHQPHSYNLAPSNWEDGFGLRRR